MVSSPIKRVIIQRIAQRTLVSFPNLSRAFEAICRLSNAGRLAKYDAFIGSQHWISFDCQQVMPFALV